MIVLNDERILLTGGSGFIGKHIIEYFNNNVVNAELKILNSRLDNVDGMIDEINEFKPTAVIHLAGVALIKQDEKNPDEIVKTNVTGTFNLVRILPRGCKFILASTITVYGDKEINNRSFDEKTSILKPTSIYASTKIACENIVNVYTNQGYINGVSLRLCAVVGKHTSHGILYDFVNKLYSDNPELEVLGEYPGSSKPFIYADDACCAFFKAIEKTPTYDRVFNICNRDICSVQDVAMSVMSGLGIYKPIKWLGQSSTWKGDNKLIDANCGWAGCLLGWYPRYNSVSAIYKASQDILNENYSR